jgi:hypothetical protein
MTKRKKERKKERKKASKQIPYCLLEIRQPAS